MLDDPCQDCTYDDYGLRVLCRSCQERRELRVAYIRGSDERVSRWGPDKQTAFYRAVERITNPS